MGIIVNNEIIDFGNKKIFQCRDRLIQILLCSSSSQAIEYARKWQKQDITPPEFHHILVLAMGRGNRGDESIMKIYLALLDFKEAKESFDKGQLVEGLDKLFAVERLMVELEIRPRLIKALGKRGGKKKEENRKPEKIASRRYYRENNLFRLTDKAAGRILFSEVSVELRTAEKYSAEYKKLAKATDEFIDNLSKILKSPALVGADKEANSDSHEIKQAAFDAYVTDLKNLMGENFDFPVSINDHADVESYLAALKIKMFDAGGL
jgi:hypothetical protein